VEPRIVRNTECGVRPEPNKDYISPSREGRQEKTPLVPVCPSRSWRLCERPNSLSFQDLRLMPAEIFAGKQEFNKQRYSPASGRNQTKTVSRQDAKAGRAQRTTQDEEASRGDAGTRRIGYPGTSNGQPTTGHWLPITAYRSGSRGGTEDGQGNRAGNTIDSREDAKAAKAGGAEDG